MADLLGTISANYVAVGQQVNKAGKYVDVDPNAYQGTWSGKYSDGKSFEIQVSNVTGFRAKVKYQDSNGLRYQEVLIKDNAFRIGDSKFTLTRAGVAQVKTVVTNAATGGSTLETAFAKQN